ncbi:N-acetyl-glucosamine-6-phosphate deacetylase [Cryptotrichosporon argae]
MVTTHPRSGDASPVIRFTNGWLALPDGTAVKRDLYVAAGQIISGQASFYSHALPARTVDLGGNLLAPGLIDVQINGAYGVDFSELELEPGAEGEAKYVAGLERVAARITETGTTSFVPTIITQKTELYAKILRLLRPRSGRGAHVLGYHAEGPFLHPHRCGMHDTALLLTATTTATAPPMRAFDDVYGPGLDQDGVKMITLAPDVEGVMGCVAGLTARGVVVSIGHSDASLDVAAEAVDRGARMITHLFNAMPPIHHRDPGVIGLLGDPQRPISFGIIVDGLHSHPNTVRIAYAAAKDRCILVTDAQSMLDPSLPDGVHDFRPGVKFRKEGLKVVIDGTDTLAGSAIPFHQCVANLASYASITLPEALVCATANPAHMLGPAVAARKGRLEPGFDADLVVLDWQGRVVSTWVMGDEVYRAGRT